MPSSFGMAPVSDLLKRLRWLTRLFVTVTPVQLAIAVPVSQLSAVPVPTSVASEASSASQSSTRPPLVTAEPPTAVEPAHPNGTVIANVNESASLAAVFVSPSVTLYV